MLKQGNQSKVMFEDGIAAMISSYSCAARTVAVNVTAAMAKTTTTKTKKTQATTKMATMTIDLWCW